MPNDGSYIHHIAAHIEGGIVDYLDALNRINWNAMLLHE
jgi:hypothetical protein